MIETDHSFVIDAPIGEVWAHAGDIGNWASSMPGYESFEEVDELHSNWVLKVALGALTRRVLLKVTITDRREPGHISFELRGGSDPFEGRGTFAAAARGPQRTSVVVSLAIWGSGPMAATMEAMSRPVVPRMTRVVSDSFKNAVEQSGTAVFEARQSRGRWRKWLLGWTRWLARGSS
jgi:carbon monoxide dehydrogenase subunit G